MTYQPRIKDFKEAVAHAFQVTPADLSGRSSAQRHVVPRQALCGLLRELAGLSYPRIGEIVNRDHTTVMDAVRRFPQREADIIYGERIRAAREALQGGIFRSCRNKPVDT